MASHDEAHIEQALAACETVCGGVRPRMAKTRQEAA